MELSSASRDIIVFACLGCYSRTRTGVAICNRKYEIQVYRASRNAMTWDIHVPMGFQINVTVLDLHMTYHPQTHCHHSLMKNGRYNGQGLAIGNRTSVCQCTKRQSYLVPMNEVRLILNFTWIPDNPVLEYMYEAMMPRESMESYLTQFQLHFSDIVYFESFQSTKQRLILYIKTSVRHTVSLVNVTLACKNNFSKVKELYFTDGPVFLLGSYLQSDAFIARMHCANVPSSARNGTMKDNDDLYIYMDEVNASIGDLTVVLQGPDPDMSELNFKFNSHLPDTPYGLFNFTNYTDTEPHRSAHILSDINLPIEGRHFHVTYLLQWRSWKSQSSPRLLFQFVKFDMVSFEDGCNTGGIFIVENDTTIASYCSRAGVAFLNSTPEAEGMLFGISPLVIILKGYSWFASIQLIISVSYDRCLGVTNICDKFLRNSPIFPDKCNAGSIPCRYVKPDQCLESVQLPSDMSIAYRTACQVVAHINYTTPFGYIGFPNTLFIVFGVKSHLELTQDSADLQEFVPVINPTFMEGTFYFPSFPFRFGSSTLKLNRKYNLRSDVISTRIVNAYFWLGMGLWFRLKLVPGCGEPSVSLHPKNHVAIQGGCGQLGITSDVGHAKIWFDDSVFTDMQISLFGVKTFYDFIHVAFILPEIEQGAHYRAKVFFNAKLQWSPRPRGDGGQKSVVYKRRRYLQMTLFCHVSYHKLSIELELERSLNQLQIVYFRRIAIPRRDFIELEFNTSWIGDKQAEMCFKNASSCYRYHEASQITWNIAQARCAEQSTNLLSINSPMEWHSLLKWAYNYPILSSEYSFLDPTNDILETDAFNGRLMFIGQRRKVVSNIAWCIVIYYSTTTSN